MSWEFNNAWDPQFISLGVFKQRVEPQVIGRGMFKLRVKPASDTSWGFQLTARGDSFQTSH